jgi:hypothetical protein
MTAVIVQFRPELAKLPVTLTRDSVFDEPIKNEKTENATDAETKKVEADAEAVKKEENDGSGDEVSTSNSLKRNAPSSELEGPNGSEHKEKKPKMEPEDVESSAIDSEAVAVSV